MIRTCVIAGLVFGSWLVLPPANVRAEDDPYNRLSMTSPAPYWGYARTPYGSDLFGLADLTRATSEYHLRIQHAAQEREKTRRMKLETRKHELEHMKWERKFMWDMHQEETQRVIQYEEKRARERPPLTEVLAGISLNWLLRDLKKESSPNAQSQPLQQAWLDNVNFVATGGNAGMLRQTKLSWPVLLQADRLAASRDQIEVLLDQARKDARADRVSAKVVQELLLEHQRLDDGATAEAMSKGSVWGPTQHIMAIRYLRELKQTILLLQNPKEASFLLTHVPQCKTVAELVQHMREHALTFGPAGAGSERQYVSLHDAFAQEAQQQARRNAPRSSVP